MMRIKEAIEAAKAAGRDVKPMEIAARLWPNSAPSARSVLYYKLVTGRATMLRPEWVTEICTMCGCDPNYLFGWKK